MPLFPPSAVLGVLPPWFISGLVYSYSTASVVLLSGGSCRSDDDTFDIVTTDAMALIFDMTVSGPGGRRSGVSESSGTWYSLWVIADSSGANLPNTLMDTVSTGMTPLPSGYDKKRRIGWVRNDNSSNIRSFNVVRTAGYSREVHMRYTDASAQVLTSGTAAVMTNIDLSAHEPPTTTLTYLKAAFLGGATIDIVRWRSTVDSAILSPPQITYGGDTAAGSSMASETFYIYTPDQILQYQIPLTGSASAYVLGWVDDLVT